MRYATRYRRAIPADAADCLALRGRTRENAFTRAQLRALGITVQSWRAGIRDGSLPGHVCRIAGRTVGYCFGDAQAGEVVVLALLPGAEGRGIGRALLQRVVDDLRAHGHQRLFLACAADPAVRSHGFYRHLGWRPTGEHDAAGDEILELWVGTEIPSNWIHFHDNGIMDVDTHLAKRIRNLRKHHGHTLDALAELSGVSRSMISLIEREETSPTAAVLNKLADALGVTLASLFAEEARSTQELPLARRAEQPVWQDPASGYLRRHVSPSAFASPLELAEVTFPPGRSVTFERAARHTVTHQQVWMLEGEMQITLNDKAWRLKTGDCLAMVLDERIVFRNPTRVPARYAIVLTTLPSTPRGLP